MQNDSFAMDFGQLYQSKKILITGGAGFLGSNLAMALANFDTHLIILDSLNPLYGGNLFNLKELPSDKYKFIKGDIRDFELLAKIVQEVDIVFHFAAQVSYIDSGKMPYEDLEVNARGTLNILEAIRHSAKRIKVIFPSSRMVLGVAKTNPITEDHPTDPLTMYGIHKLAAEKYLKIYYRDHRIPCTIFRITNPYGPRQQVKHSKYSLVGWFIRLAMEGRSITIFGDGAQRRDYILIDDIVEAFLRAGVNSISDGKTYNLGSGRSIQFREMVNKIVAIIGKGKIEYVPWPENYEHIETGDITIDTALIKKDLGWESRYSLEQGIKITYEYYKKYLASYL